jgi:argininosuccinate lyase
MDRSDTNQQVDKPSMDDLLNRCHTVIDEARDLCQQLNVNREQVRKALEERATITDGYPRVRRK